MIILTVILMACAVWTLVGNGSIPPRWYGPFFMLALVSLIMVVFLRGLVEHVPHGVRRARLVKYGFAASLTFYGFGSFFAQFLAASGALTMIGPSTEWPVGPVDHVAQDANGTLIVPLVPQGRVQIYDRSGRFVRGWFVEAAGGDFRIKPTTDGHIEVHTARGHSRLVYSYEGALVSRTPDYADAFGRIEPGGELQITMPFNWLLWPLISPFWAWITGVLGLVAVGLVGKRRRGGR